MARNSQLIVITDNTRDKGKAYVITEMSSADAEWWAMRAFSAMAAGGVDLPEGIMDAGMEGWARLGLKALAEADPIKVKPLMDELWACVKFVPNPSNPKIVRDIMTDDDVEEVSTRMYLRARVFSMHLDFLQAVVPSKSLKTAASQSSSLDTPTSHEPSVL